MDSNSTHYILTKSILYALRDTLCIQGLRPWHDASMHFFRYLNTTHALVHARVTLRVVFVWGGRTRAAPAGGTVDFVPVSEIQAADRDDVSRVGKNLSIGCRAMGAVPPFVRYYAPERAKGCARLWRKNRVSLNSYVTDMT